MQVEIIRAGYDEPTIKIFNKDIKKEALFEKKVLKDNLRSIFGERPKHIIFNGVSFVDENAWFNCRIGDMFRPCHDQLHKIYFDRCSFGPQSLIRILEELVQNEKLRYVKFERCAIYEFEIYAIMKMAMRHKKLRVLEVTMMEDVEFVNSMVEECLIKNNSLRILKINACMDYLQVLNRTLHSKLREELFKDYPYLRNRNKYRRLYQEVVGEDGKGLEEFILESSELTPNDGRFLWSVPEVRYDMALYKKRKDTYDLKQIYRALVLNFRMGVLDIPIRTYSKSEGLLGDGQDERTTSPNDESLGNRQDGITTSLDNESPEGDQDKRTTSLDNESPEDMGSTCSDDKLSEKKYMKMLNGWIDEELKKNYNRDPLKEDQLYTVSDKLFDTSYHPERDSMVNSDLVLISSSSDLCLTESDSDLDSNTDTDTDPDDHVQVNDRRRIIKIRKRHIKDHVDLSPKEKKRRKK